MAVKYKYVYIYIIIVVAIILVTTIVLYLCMKKENLDSSYYYVNDGTSISSSLDIDIGKQLLIGGYGGNLGDMLVSNGPSASPAWTSTDNILKIIGSATYTIPETGDLTLHIPINSDIDTSMSVIIQGSATVIPRDVDGQYRIVTVGYTIGSKSGSINMPLSSNMFRVQLPPFVGTNLSLELTITGTGNGVPLSSFYRAPALTNVLDSVIVSYFKVPA